MKRLFLILLIGILMGCANKHVDPEYGNDYGDGDVKHDINSTPGDIIIDDVPITGHIDYYFEFDNKVADHSDLAPFLYVQPPTPTPAPIENYVYLIEDWLDDPINCLHRISKLFYGDSSRWREIYEVNKKIIGDNPHKIPKYTIIKIPNKGITFDDYMEPFSFWDTDTEEE